MIKPVTSMADLYFKCKTNPLYRRLVLVFVNVVIDDNIRNFDEAYKLLEDYRIQNCQSDCSWLVRAINRLRERVYYTETAETIDNPSLKVLKARQSAPTNAVFCDVPISFAVNGYVNDNIYERASQEYNRLEATEQYARELNDRPIGTGSMMEYGWWDRDIEWQISNSLTQNPSFTRNDAIIHVLGI